MCRRQRVVIKEGKQSRVVVMGEKITNAMNYYVEILSGESTYDARATNPATESRSAPTISLYLDTHVDSHGPTSTLYGADPWDFPYPATDMWAD